jgi:hypothetical protein
MSKRCISLQTRDSYKTGCLTFETKKLLEKAIFSRHDPLIWLMGYFVKFLDNTVAR